MTRTNREVIVHSFIIKCSMCFYSLFSPTPAPTRATTPAPTPAPTRSALATVVAVTIPHQLPLPPILSFVFEIMCVLVCIVIQLSLFIIALLIFVFHILKAMPLFVAAFLSSMVIGAMMGRRPCAVAHAMEKKDKKEKKSWRPSTSMTLTDLQWAASVLKLHVPKRATRADIREAIIDFLDAQEATGAPTVEASSSSTPDQFTISTPLECEVTDNEDEGELEEGEEEEDGEADPVIEFFDDGDVVEKEFGQVQMEAVFEEIPFNMFIKDFEGRNHTVQVTLSDTIFTLTVKIRDKLGYIPNDLRLVVMGRQMVDGCPLSQYSPMKDGYIHMLGRVHGDGKRATSSEVSKEERLQLLNMRLEHSLMGADAAVKKECDGIISFSGFPADFRNMNVDTVKKLRDKVFELTVYTPTNMSETIATHTSTIKRDNLEEIARLQRENDAIDISMLIALTKHKCHEKHGRFDYQGLTDEIESTVTFLEGVSQGIRKATADVVMG